MKNKVGRPKKEKESVKQCAFYLNETTDRHITELANSSYISRAGIVRMAIDYLYYTSNGIKVPDELQVLIDDLRNEVKIN